MPRFSVGQTVRAVTAVQGLTKGELYQVVELKKTTVLGDEYVSYGLVGDPMDGVLWVGNGHLLLTEVNDKLPSEYVGMHNGKRRYWVKVGRNTVHQVEEVDAEQGTYRCSCTDGDWCDHILSILRERSEFEKADEKMGDATP